MLQCSIRQMDELFVNKKYPRLCYIYKQNFGIKRLTRPLHVHDTFAEIVLITAGQGIYRVGSQAYPVCAGDVVFTNINQHHELVKTIEEEFGTYCLGFCDFQRPSLPPNMIFPEDSVFVRPSGALFEPLRAMSETIYAALGGCTQPADHIPSHLPLLFSAYFGLLFSLEPPPHIMADDSQKFLAVERAISYICQHFPEPFTLDDLADKLNCSAPYISHAFKKVTGYSPMQYKTRCRIGEAQNLLVASDLTSTQIATLVGYDNTNYFNTVFTKIVGISPIRFRKDYLSDMKGTREM